MSIVSKIEPKRIRLEIKGSRVGDLYLSNASYIYTLASSEELNKFVMDVEVELDASGGIEFNYTAGIIFTLNTSSPTVPELLKLALNSRTLFNDKLNEAIETGGYSFIATLPEIDIPKTEKELQILLT